ncbi:MAG: hypothetical protein HYY40_07830, partial [Bacteroidetes bacterium]|nr:hypothetical protein [Bacteroidota bacterium]
MRKKITLSLSIAVAMLFNSQFARANSDSTKIYFQQAYNELKNMLEGKQPISYERAVFTTENAYYGNKYSYVGYQEMIDGNLFLIKGLMKSSNREDSLNFSTKIDPIASKIDISTLRYTEKEKRELYRKTLANWAIYKYMTDTLFFEQGNHLPFTYQINDPFGMNDWKNSQVINLLISTQQKGNCFALTSLFKIFADRLNSEAYICTA